VLSRRGSGATTTTGRTSTTCCAGGTDLLRVDFGAERFDVGAKLVRRRTASSNSAVRGPAARSARNSSRARKLFVMASGVDIGASVSQCARAAFVGAGGCCLFRQGSVRRDHLKNRARPERARLHVTTTICHGPERLLRRLHSGRHPVRTAIIGLGRVYELNVRAYVDNPEADVVALVDPSDLRRAQRQIEWPAPRLSPQSAN